MCSFRDSCRAGERAGRPGEEGGLNSEWRFDRLR